MHITDTHHSWTLSAIVYHMLFCLGMGSRCKCAIPDLPVLLTSAFASAAFRLCSCRLYPHRNPLVLHSYSGPLVRSVIYTRLGVFPPARSQVACFYLFKPPRLSLSTGSLAPDRVGRVPPHTPNLRRNENR